MRNEETWILVKVFDGRHDENLDIPFLRERLTNQKMCT